jgi:hypothetical protein
MREQYQRHPCAGMENRMILPQREPPEIRPFHFAAKCRSKIEFHRQILSAGLTVTL